MINPKAKILGYIIYLILAFGLCFLLFWIRNQFNYVAGALRELFSYSIIGLTFVYLVVIVLYLIKTKRKKIAFYGVFGIIPFLISIPFFQSPISVNNSLTEKTETIELSYIAWGCECANWATSQDEIKFSEDIDSLAYHCIFIEPSKASVELPDTLFYNNTLIRFTGQFYKERGFPKDHQKSEQNPEAARVFRYSKYEVIKSYYQPIDWDEKNN